MTNIKKSEIHPLVLIKNIDGGTGTYCLSFKKLKDQFKKGSKESLKINYVVLEKPTFRILNKDDNKNFIFFRKKSLYKSRINLSLKNILIFIKDLFFLSEFIKKYNPNIILGVDHYCNLIISILKMFLFKNKKIILSTLINIDDNIEQRADPILKILLRKSITLFYNKADALVFPSKKLADYTSKKFLLDKKLITTIYNGIETKNKIRIKENKQNIIINISRLVEQKDHTTLLKAFSLIYEKIPNSYLWIVSDGYKKKQLINLANKLKIKNRVKFFGWVKDIYCYLKKAKIFVFSSKREGFGYVILEAMSQGLPVVSTDTPCGPLEILDNGRYGVLVPMKDPQAMAKAMYELLTDEKKYNYYSKKSLERVKYFSLEKMLKAYKKIILDLANK